MALRVSLLTRNAGGIHGGPCFVVRKGILVGKPLFSGHQIYIFLNAFLNFRRVALYKRFEPGD